MNKASTPSQKKSGPAKQKPLFEVEIQTGNRAQSVRSPVGDRTKSPAEAGSPLALRRQRSARRLFLARLFLITLAFLLTVWGTAKWWQPWLVGDVVARVNNQIITYQQVEKEIRLSKALSVATTGKEQALSTPAMLEQMILLELEVQAAQQASFTVSQQDVDAQIAQIVKQAGILPAKLAEVLRGYGLTSDDLRASSRQNSSRRPVRGAQRGRQCR